MSQLFTNNALSLLSNSISLTDLVIEVIPGDGDLFPQPLTSADYFIVTLEDDTANYREIIKIIDRVGDTLIVDPAGRGFEDTVVRAWPVDTLVDHRVTAWAFKQVQSGNSSINGDTQLPSDVIIVDPNTSLITNTFTAAFPNNLVAKWLVTCVDPISQKVSASEVLAVYRGPTLPPIFSQYAKTGDKISYQINISTTGSLLELSVTNNHTNPLTINWLRINY